MWTTTRSDRHRGCAAVLLALSVALAADAARADEPVTTGGSTAPDPLDSLRERFRAGRDKYMAGAFADAVVIWEAVYRELGTDKGYRLAFDLGRAYDELGDLIKAADHYESYLEQVARRRAASETLEANVERQEEVARERLEKIAARKARIRVKAGPRPSIVQVDNAPARVAGFTVYVEPGAHIVTFGSGKDADARRLTVALGAIADVEPADEVPVALPPPETRYEMRVEHPFSPAVLWIGGGVAALSLVLPAIIYGNALSIKSDYDDPSTPRTDKARLASDYDSARTNAYASVVVPAVFTAALGGLAVWYVLGTKETRTPITPSATVGPTGLSLGAAARF